jgi:hypothetical protein
VATFSITATAASGGSITPAGTSIVSYGGSKAYTISADAAHAIGDVAVDGASQGALAAYTFTNVQANHTIAATFNAVWRIASYGGSNAWAPHIEFACAGGPTGLATADLNGDGRPDVVASAGGGLSVFLGSAIGTFGASADYQTDAGATAVAIGDLNGDGKLDLAATNRFSDKVSVLLGDGLGGFGSHTDYTTGSQPKAVALAM